MSRRFIVIGLGAVVLLAGGLLALQELRRSIVFTHGPSECVRDDVPEGARSRLPLAAFTTATVAGETKYLYALRVGGPWLVAPAAIADGTGLDVSGADVRRERPWYAKATLVHTDREVGLALVRLEGAPPAHPPVAWADASAAGAAYLVTPDIHPCPDRVLQVTLTAPSPGSALGRIVPTPHDGALGSTVLLPDGRIAGVAVLDGSRPSGQRLAVLPAPEVRRFVEQHAR